MFRKFACVLSAAAILLTVRVYAQAAGATGSQYLGKGSCLAVPWAVPVADATFLGAGGDVLAMELATEENRLPDTGDYPAPILTAMMISFGVVVLLVMTENRKK